MSNETSSPTLQAIRDRLAELKREDEAGGQQEAAMEQRLRDLRHTRLRIQGAIAVLEEMVREQEHGQ